jgi:subtilisin family serine protease
MAAINLSLSGRRGDGPGEQDAVMSAVGKAADKGIFVSVAAGNSGEDAEYYSPAAQPNACTVGAIDKDDNFWPHSNSGSRVDILAPGVDVLSADYNSELLSRRMTGTSMAAPHVAGVAATWMASGLVSPGEDICHLLTMVADTLTKPRPEGTTDRILNNAEM